MTRVSVSMQRHRRARQCGRASPARSAVRQHRLADQGGRSAELTGVLAHLRLYGTLCDVVPTVACETSFHFGSIGDAGNSRAMLQLADVSSASECNIVSPNTLGTSVDGVRFCET